MGREECKAVLVPASMCLMWYSEIILGGTRKLTDETVVCVFEVEERIYCDVSTVPPSRFDFIVLSFVVHQNLLTL